MKFSFKPIYRINNTFLRRVLTVLIVPTFAALGFLVMIPVGSLLDFAVAMLKLVRTTLYYTFVTAPKNFYIVEKEMFKISKIAVLMGWSGNNG